MKQLMILAVGVMLVVPAISDTFGTGDNQFTIDFVPISGDASSANGTNISTGLPGEIDYKTFTDPGHDYRIAKYQITNAQWASFEAETGLTFTSSYWTGAQIPVNRKNWHAAAQFINWLNTENGHQAAYNIEGGTFSIWDASDSWDSTNVYRHKDAFYFLPTEDEWVKAAYWNGINLQHYATICGSNPVLGTGSNYNNFLDQPWAVGSGSIELNGTCDMMGNVWEWMETPQSGRRQPENYQSDSSRVVRGGSYLYNEYYGDIDDINIMIRDHVNPISEHIDWGFRVASIPEPTTLLLLGMGGLLMRKITGPIDKK